MLFGIDPFEIVVVMVAIFLVMITGQKIFYFLRRKVDISAQLTKDDNLAVGLSLIGYMTGLLLACSGLVAGPSSGYLGDFIDIAIYGALAIILLNLATVLSEKILLHKFSNVKELVQDRNMGVGAVELGIYVAGGLILMGALHGQGGGIDTAIAFWAAGQLTLIVLFKIYDLMTPFNIHEHLEKDNGAVGIATAGMLIATGNIIRIGISGDFLSWQINFSQFAIYTGICAVSLPLTRVIIDFLFIPGAKITDEIVNQEKPNIAVALFEAGSYIGVSFLLGGLFV